MTARIDVRNGTVHIPADVADRYFDGIDAVVVLIRDGLLWILPVRQTAAGGCLLKRRNLAGDRVASAPDVFHANHLDDWVASKLEATWSADRGALIAEIGNCKLSLQ